ncbi:hypothetical protein [Micromonospora sp. LOL_023]|uniref:hypothetical protein n=1 Tax=Micromonospora sp. LOL_023 TaxID=3345418 RepID=UPI003A86D6CD
MRAVDALKIAIATGAVAAALTISAGAAHADTTDPAVDAPTAATTASPTPAPTATPGAGTQNHPWD